MFSIIIVYSPQCIYYSKCFKDQNIIIQSNNLPQTPGKAVHLEWTIKQVALIQQNPAAGNMVVGRAMRADMPGKVVIVGPSQK